MIKILHTADLHLDSPFSSLGLAAAERIRNEQKRVFIKMMDYARENAVDLVLISGDLFDGKYISSETKNLVKKAFASLSCPVVIAPGNHDPYSTTSLYNSGELSENVYVFSSEEIQIFDLDEIGISVCGYAFMTDRLERSPISDLVPRKTLYPLVLCAHADLGAVLSKYAPVSLAEILRCNFAYAALGHIHNEPDSLPENVRYCGFPTGRSFDELGEGGAYLVELDGEKVSASKVIFSEHRFIKDSLDVSSADEIADLERLIRRHVEAKGYGSETSLCLELIGALPLSLTPDTKRLEKISLPTSMLKLKDSTTALPDTRYLADDLTLRGELYRTLLPALTSSDADERKNAALALRLGLCAIDGQSISDILGIDN